MLKNFLIYQFRMHLYCVLNFHIYLGLFLASLFCSINLSPKIYVSLGEGNGNPLQYSSLGNPMDGGAWWATVHGVAKSWTELSN